MFLLLIIFIVVPLAELYVIIQVGGAIGVLPTLALLLLDSILGAVLLRHQGRAAWVAFNRALAENRVPAKEVFDGVLVIFGAAFLITPGFLTDIVGILLLLPPTRAAVRGLSTRFAWARVSLGPRVAWWGYDKARGGRGAPAGHPARPGDIDGTAEEVTGHDSLERGADAAERTQNGDPGGERR
ncbi:MAG: FxsA family protein [Solirubrobacterales bacterium]|nr:FxsA family protein [Solirubrobacterales bacterium]